MVPGTWHSNIGVMYDTKKQNRMRHNTLLAPHLDLPSPSKKCPEASWGGACQPGHPGTGQAALALASCQHNASISTIWQISYPPTLFPALLIGYALFKNQLDQGVELELKKKKAFKSLLLFFAVLNRNR